MLSILQKQYQEIEILNEKYQVKFKNSDRFFDFLSNLKEKQIEYKFFGASNERKKEFKEINFKQFRLLFNYN